MVHSMCFAKSMAMLMNLICQVLMVWVPVLMWPTSLPSLDWKSWAWLFFKGGCYDHASILTVHSSNLANLYTTKALIGPITCCWVKTIQQLVQMLVFEFKLNTNENFMLPKSCMLILVRFTKEKGQNTLRVNQKEEFRSSLSSMIELYRRNSHIFWLPKDMKTHKHLLESSWSLNFNPSKLDSNGSPSKMPNQF